VISNIDIEPRDARIPASRRSSVGSHRSRLVQVLRSATTTRSSTLRSSSGWSPGSTPTHRSTGPTRAGGTSSGRGSRLPAGPRGGEAMRSRRRWSSWPQPRSRRRGPMTRSSPRSRLLDAPRRRTGGRRPRRQVEADWLVQAMTRAGLPPRKKGAPAPTWRPSPRRPRPSPARSPRRTASPAPGRSPPTSPGPAWTSPPTGRRSTRPPASRTRGRPTSPRGARGAASPSPAPSSGSTDSSS